MKIFQLACQNCTLQVWWNFLRWSTLRFWKKFIDRIFILKNWARCFRKNWPWVCESCFHLSQKKLVSWTNILNKMFSVSEENFLGTSWEGFSSRVKIAFCESGETFEKANNFLKTNWLYNFFRNLNEQFPDFSQKSQNAFIYSRRNIGFFAQLFSIIGFQNLRKTFWDCLEFFLFGCQNWIVRVQNILRNRFFDFFKKFFRGLDEGIVGLLSKKVRHVCRNWFLRFQTTVSTKHNFLREKNFLNVWFRKVSENYLDCWQKKFRHVGENGNLLVQRKVMVKNLFSLSIRW